MSAIRRRRPGIASKWLLVSVALLAIPSLAIHYLGEVEKFVLEGQSSSLQLAAQAVSTVLQDRKDLFDLEALTPAALGGCSTLPLGAPIRLQNRGVDPYQLWKSIGHYRNVA